MTRTGDFIQTYTGQIFWPLDPLPEEIHIKDIAHALANICRFCGHTREFYSVAQHSVLVSRIVQPPWALEGLLHDAQEAYISDVSKPVKPFLTEYARIEHRLYETIAERFDIHPSIPSLVKRADLILLATERRDLMTHSLVKWNCLHGIEPMDEEIVPWTPQTAEAAFLRRFEELQQ